MINYSSPAFHHMLINDQPRSLAYQQAIAEIVRPGDTVLDIGAGSGILSMFACQAGASRVYAVERTSMAGVVRALAQANGFSDRIEVLQQDIRTVRLPERVDVVVSELISQGMVGQLMESLTEYARTYMLKPSGHFIPGDVEYFVAPVCCPSAWASLESPADGLYGLDFGPFRRPFLNQLKSVRFDRCSLLAPPQRAYQINSATVVGNNRPSISGSFEFERANDCHGLLVWFRSRLSPNVVIDNLGQHGSWSPVLLPMPRAIPVSPKMVMRFNLSGKQLSNGDCVYQWHGAFETPSQDAETPQVVSTFSQSSLKQMRRALKPSLL